MFIVNRVILRNNLPNTQNVIRTAVRKIANNEKIAQGSHSVYLCALNTQCTIPQNSYYNTSYNTILAKHYSTSNNTDFWSKLRSVYEERKSAFFMGVFVLTGTIIYSTIKFKNKEKLENKISTSIQLNNKRIIKSPPSSDAIPDHVPYLLIGGGTASFSAFRAIKSSDPLAKVLVIGNEGNFPYMRPPLSKEIWLTDDSQLRKSLKFKQWNGSERSLFYEPEDFYVRCEELSNVVNGGVAVARGWTVTKIDVANRTAYLDDGKKITYEKCLIATGAVPRNLDIFEKAPEKIKEKVSLFRTIYDFEDLENICDNAETIAVIGGGFLGSEISCALARYGKTKPLKIKQIFTEKGNMGKVLPEYLSEWTTKKVRAEGVDVIPGVQIINAKLNNYKKLVLDLNNGLKVEADHVIVAIGVEPNTKLAETSDLEVDPNVGGFVVNAELEARSNLYAAGDCACFYDVKLGRRRVEHHDHAVVSGRLAGENMTGAKKPYTHQSMFWSDLGPEIGYEAIGIVDSSLKTFGIFVKNENKEKQISSASSEQQGEKKEESKHSSEPVKQDKNKTVNQGGDTTNDDIEDYSKGLVFYLKNDIVVGIVLWNLFNRMSIARQVIKEHRKFDDLSELAKLFSIYDEE